MLPSQCYDMVYNWEGKEAECYRLYVHEKRSLQEVVAYWEQRGFTPSKRAFQTQFKRWGFPNKQSPAHKDHILTARVKELWEANTTQKDMLNMLQTEGFQISDRELVRLRSRFKWFLRESRSQNADGEKRKRVTRSQKRGAVPHDLIDQLAAAILQEESPSEDETSHSHTSPSPPRTSPPASPLSPAEALRRHLRQQQLQADSDAKWRARKRRRRTRPWSSLPADAPSEPPRFPSETTLEESKAYLSLTPTLYTSLRSTFHTLCTTHSVTKKSTAGPEPWASLLRTLIRSSPSHLVPLFAPYPSVFTHADALWKPKERLALALDVICQDVTKRMRVAGSRMGVTEAKRVLGLNPEEARRVKGRFLEILVRDRFTDKVSVGLEHWEGLKRGWVEGEEGLRGKVGEGGEEGRAVEVLARDVMKRLRARERAGKGAGAKGGRSALQEGTRAVGVPVPVPVAVADADADLQIDPSLLAASDAAILHV